MAEYDSKIQIARDVMEEFFTKGEPFSPEEPNEEILKRGGIFRMAPGYTIGQFYENKEESGAIKYNALIDKFEFPLQN